MTARLRRHKAVRPQQDRAIRETCIFACHFILCVDRTYRDLKAATLIPRLSAAAGNALRHAVPADPREQHEASVKQIEAPRTSGRSIRIASFS